MFIGPPFSYVYLLATEHLVNSSTEGNMRFYNFSRIGKCWVISSFRAIPILTVIYFVSIDLERVEQGLKWERSYEALRVAVTSPPWSRKSMFYVVRGLLKYYYITRSS